MQQREAKSSKDHGRAKKKTKPAYNLKMEVLCQWFYHLKVLQQKTLDVTGSEKQARLKCYVIVIMQNVIFEIYYPGS